MNSKKVNKVTDQLPDVNNKYLQGQHHLNGKSKIALALNKGEHEDSDDSIISYNHDENDLKTIIDKNRAKTLHK